MRRWWLPCLMLLAAGCTRQPSDAERGSEVVEASTAYYVDAWPDDGSARRYRLTNEFAAKLIEVADEPGMDWAGAEIKAAPRGVFLVGDRKFHLWGNFISEQAEGERFPWGKGRTWIHSMFFRFWEQLNRQSIEGPSLKQLVEEFKP